MKTALYDEHVALGGRIVDFAGWDLPVMYSSIVEEHTATRTAAGLFDVSHMGEVRVAGAGAEAYLKALIPTRMDKLYPGKSMYSCFCNERGGVIDDLFIYMISHEEYFLVVNASTTAKDLAWMRTHLTPGVELTDLSAETSKIDLQGPKSSAILSKVISDGKVASLERFHFTDTAYRGKMITVSKSGYTGEAGFELYLPNELAAPMWRDLLEAGGEFGIRPAGLGSRDSLRLESCYSLYGHELSEEVTPLESGIGWIISSQERYVGRETLDSLKAKGVDRAMMYYVLTGKGVPREGCPVLKNGAEIGVSTSAGYSPTMRNGIGIARVTRGAVSVGEEVEVVIRDRPVRAVAVERPFYQYHG